jgi:hypothetical protein
VVLFEPGPQRCRVGHEQLGQQGCHGSDASRGRRQLRRSAANRRVCKFSISWWGDCAIPARRRCTACVPHHRDACVHPAPPSATACSARRWAEDHCARPADHLFGDRAWLHVQVTVVSMWRRALVVPKVVLHVALRQIELPNGRSSAVRKVFAAPAAGEFRPRHPGACTARLARTDTLAWSLKGMTQRRPS